MASVGRGYRKPLPSPQTPPPPPEGCRFTEPGRFEPIEDLCFQSEQLMSRSAHEG